MEVFPAPHDRETASSEKWTNSEAANSNYPVVFKIFLESLTISGDDRIIHACCIPRRLVQISNNHVGDLLGKPHASHDYA